MRLDEKISKWLEVHKTLRMMDDRGEDGANEEQIKQYIKLIRGNKWIKAIGEIGFNTGLSTRAFLEASKDIYVLSFDLMEYKYSEMAKTMIDLEYPGRHMVIRGDSRETVGKYGAAWNFDLIAIDGCHEEEAAAKDILNMKDRAHPFTFLIVDDLRPWRGFGEGPAQAVEKLQNEGVLTEGRIFESKYTVEVDGINRPIRRWWVGKYQFNELDKDAD